MRQRSLRIVVGGMAILLFGRELRAGTLVVGSHVTAGVVSRGVGMGVWIGTPRPGWLLPPHRGVVVLRPPAVERVVVERPAIVRSPAPLVEEGTITVWITNSNGSRTSVQLTRQGPWYIGPRGEYYADMPSNEQLRVVYGF